MDNKDRLINDLALENAQLRIDNMELKYEIERLLKVNQELSEKGGDE